MQLLLDILGALVVGGVAGWLAGLIMKGSGFGVVGNVIVGMIGGFLTGLLLSVVNIGFISGPVTRLIASVVGAVVLLFIIGLFRGGSTTDNT